MAFYILDLKYMHYNSKFFSWSIRSSTFTYLEEEILQQAGRKPFSFCWSCFVRLRRTRDTNGTEAVCHVNEIEWGLIVEYISFVAPQQISWHIKSMTDHKCMCSGDIIMRHFCKLVFNVGFSGESCLSQLRYLFLFFNLVNKHLKHWNF